MMASGKAPAARSERGSVLVLVMLISLVLIGLGLSALWLSSSGNKVAGNLIRQQEARTAAMAGLERARTVAAGIIATGNFTGLLGTAAGGSCGATKDDPWGKGNVMCEGGVPLENVSVLQGSNSAAKATDVSLIAYTVYIRNDTMESTDAGVVRAGNRFQDVNQQVIVRVEAVGKDGQSQVTLEAVLLPGGTTAGGQGGKYGGKGGGPTGAGSGDTTIQ